MKINWSAIFFVMLFSSCIALVIDASLRSAAIGALVGFGIQFAYFVWSEVRGS